MKKNISKKILIITFCIVLIVMTISMSIIVKNIFHITHCDIPKCSLCTIINLSNDYIKNIFFISTSVFMLISIFPLTKLILKCIKETKNVTLVQLKVIQNR